MRSLLVRGSVGLAVFAALGLGACQAPGGPSTSPTLGAGDSNAGVGSVSFALQLGKGYTINSVGYEISGNNFDRKGTIDVSQSSAVSTIVTGIPVGTGYTATLSVAPIPNKLYACQGSSMFNVSSANTVAVPVHLTCQAVPPPQGPSVPVPPAAAAALGVLLAALGFARLRRPSAS
jgi:hypothetical protein